MLRRKWRSSPTPKSKLQRNIAIVMVVLFLLLIQSYLYIERNLGPPLMYLSSVRIKQLATESINAAISDRMAQETNFEKLIDWRTDKNGKTTGFMLNYAEHMRVTSDAIQIVQNRLKQMEEMPEHIPLGQALNSPILASFGPNIPIRLVPAGAAKVDLNTRHQNAGINTILVEVYIKIRVEVTVIIPFDSAPEVVETELPISYALIVGDVPTYYFDGNGKPVGQNNPPPPNVALPELKQQTQAVQGGAGAGGAKH